MLSVSRGDFSASAIPHRGFWTPKKSPWFMADAEKYPPQNPRKLKACPCRIQGLAWLSKKQRNYTKLFGESSKTLGVVPLPYVDLFSP